MQPSLVGSLGCSSDSVQVTVVTLESESQTGRSSWFKVVVVVMMVITWCCHMARWPCILSLAALLLSHRQRVPIEFVRGRAEGPGKFLQANLQDSL